MSQKTNKLDYVNPAVAAVSINEYITLWQKIDDIAKDHFGGQNWSTRMKRGGYISVVADKQISTQQLIKNCRWCHQYIGPDHYAISDMATFWFENKEDAILFKLACLS